MKKLTLILTLLLCTLLPSAAENKIEASPINLAAMIVEKNDSATMASICEYYGYQNQPSEDGYTVFQHPNGSVIHYSFTTGDDGKQYATVETKATASHKEQDKILQILRFKKTGNSYERRSFNHTTKCLSSNGDLRFTNQPKNK